MKVKSNLFVLFLALCAIVGNPALAGTPHCTEEVVNEGKYKVDMGNGITRFAPFKTIRTTCADLTYAQWKAPKEVLAPYGLDTAGSIANPDLLAGIGIGTSGRTPVLDWGIVSALQRATGNSLSFVDGSGAPMIGIGIGGRMPHSNFLVGTASGPQPIHLGPCDPVPPRPLAPGLNDLLRLIGPGESSEISVTYRTFVGTPQ